jgi:hypothetical protein
MGASRKPGPRSGAAPRRAVVERKTAETAITVSLDLDGTGTTRVATSMPFLDHMLTVMGKHGLLDLTVRASGDLDVDCHHTVEDLGSSWDRRSSARATRAASAGSRRRGADG